MPIFISHSNPLNCPSIYVFAINGPNEHWTSWNYSKSNVRLNDSCDMMISILTLEYLYCNLFDCLELNKSYKVMIQNMPSTFYFKSSKQCYICLIFSTIFFEILEFFQPKLVPKRGLCDPLLT